MRGKWGWVIYLRVEFIFLTPPESFVPNFIKIGPLEQKFPKSGGKFPPWGVNGGG